MKYIIATVEMADAIHNILRTTIKAVYPKHYLKEVVNFFCRHHSREHILEGIVSGNMGVLLDGEIMIGTGCYDGNHITGGICAARLSETGLRFKAYGKAVGTISVFRQNYKADMLKPCRQD